MKFLFFPLFFILPYFAYSTFTIDLNSQNKYGNATIKDTLCNKDTQIDFAFSSSTQMKCTSGSCTLKNEKLSELKFLDVNGADLDLILVSAEFTDHDFVVEQNSYAFGFKFKTADGNNIVYVIVPIVDSQNATSSEQIVDVSNLDLEEFQNLKKISLDQFFSLSAFNFMNLMDFGHFYHVANDDAAVTLLVSAWTYQLSLDFSLATPSSFPDQTWSYLVSGDKLCYGSQLYEKIFQTHMRQSFPLWTAWFAMLFFWAYYLLTDTNTINCNDKIFEDNKWTCWGFFSLHYLGNDEYFSKLSRVSLMLFDFSFQGLILAAIYMSAGPTSNSAIIFWAALVAVACSWPFPFLLGGTFLRYIKETTLQKFRIIKQSKGAVMENKENDELYEQEIDQKEEKLYGLYYWYYVAIFIGFVIFWVVSIHLMQQIHRDYYYLHSYWLGSLLIGFAIDHLLDLLLTAILGNTQFYRIRGYFYDFRLGEEYKQIEE